MNIELDGIAPDRGQTGNDVPQEEEPNLPIHSRGVHAKKEHGRLQVWWAKHIRPELTAEEGDPRDYLALERTYLAYTRTANALASFAVVASQLFILNDESVVAGKVLACLSLVFAIYITIVGCIRYFKQQGSLQQNKCCLWNPDSIRVALVFFVVSVLRN
ncbi:hypothetical protein BDV25DRAFT_17391 [Aspergillus avenaceus]|uniref:DUF202 domain-containing protein n=1 Tax=Aspergillus avenaceus TaxID=36643 RepID=A0A5N6TQ34_ASPAV|nr:hypothetical protein BDV25DRAFT_17391 [Aspergillus avenaceus]